MRLNSAIVLAIMLVGFGGADSAFAFASRSGTCEFDGVPPASGQMAGRTAAFGGDGNFTIQLDSATITPGQAHTVTLARNSGMDGFRGLLLYAEDASANRIGSFAPADSAVVQGLSCAGNEQLTSTITHTSSSSFSASQAFIWTAPADIDGPVTFKAIAYESPTQWNIPTPLAVSVLGEGIFANGFEDPQ